MNDGLRLRSFGALAWRGLRARKSRGILTALGIALGVGLIFGTGLLTKTIDSTFRELYDGLYGKTDLVIVPPGNSETVAGKKLREVQLTPGVTSAQGLIYEPVRRVRDGGPSRPRKPDQATKIRLAQDPAFRERYERDQRRRARRYAREESRDRLNLVGKPVNTPDLADLEYTAGRRVRGGYEITIEDRWVEEQDLKVGDKLTLSAPAGPRTFTIVGTYEFETGGGIAGQSHSTIPLRTARRVMERPRGFDEIDVVVGDSNRIPEVQRTLQRRLGEGVDVSTPRGRSDDVLAQFGALNALLLIFSAMGLFVGAFLIFNSFAITVLERQREFGIMRTMGAGRRAIFTGVLREAMALGVVGTGLGLALGAGLGFGLVAVFSAVGFPLGDLRFSPVALVAAIAAGVFVSVFGALEPARRASRVSPLTAVQSRGAARKPPRRIRAVLGLAMIGLGLAGAFVLASAGATDAAVAAGFLGVVLLFTGVALIAPFLIVPIVAAVAAPFRRLFPVEGRIAGDSAKSTPARTAATASSLMIGLALVCAFGTVAASFLGSVTRDLDQAVSRDFTIQPQGFFPATGAPQESFSPRLRKKVAEIPEVGVVSSERIFYSRKLLRGKSGVAIGYDPKVYGEVSDPTYEDGLTQEVVLARVAQGQVTVGDALAKDLKLSVGERVKVTGSRRTITTRVAGVTKTVNFAGRQIGMSLKRMRSLYGVTKDSTLAISAASEGARPALRDRLEDLVNADYPQLGVLSNAELRADVDKRLSQQAGFFNILLTVAIAVSLLGLIGTLTMNVLERTRELGVIRALGCSRWQVRRAVGCEGLVLAMVGAALGIGVGLALGYVFTLGLGAFIPSIEYELPALTIALVAAAAVVLGLVASVLPARRAARMSVISAIAYE